MRAGARMRSWLRSLFGRRRMEAGLNEELRFHLERRAEDLMRGGMTPRDARERARAEFGPVAARMDECRDALGLRFFDAVRADLRQALRRMRQAPGVTAVAVVSIALGIGATTAVYSVVHAVLIETYPYGGADRMVDLIDQVSVKTFDAWKELDAFDGMVATDLYAMSLTSGELPESVVVARVSANTFEFLGVPPLLGRAFVAADSPRGAEPEHAAVLAYGFWQSHFGGERSALGATLRLDGETYTVTGVAPPRFRWQDAEIFVPARLDFYQEPSLQIVGRLKPGVSAAQAGQQALAAMRRLYPKLPANYEVRLRDLRAWATRKVRGTLLLFLVAVFALLAVACANVSILLLARGTARQHELALRAAMGASRRRLAGQLFTEAVLLAGAGGVLGVGLAVAGLAAILGWLPPGQFPPEADIHLNIPVLAFSTAAALLTGLAAGLAPAVRFSLPRLHGLIQAAGQRMTTGVAGRRAQQALVAVQVALTVVLLAGAGAALRGFVSLYRAKLGYDPSGFVLLTMPMPAGAYPTWAARKAMFQNALRRVAELPQVEAAALGGVSPPFGGETRQVELFGVPDDPQRRVISQEVSADYFEALRIPLRRGRVWSDAETERAAAVGVVNEAAVREFFGGGQVLGRKLRMPSLHAGQWNVSPAWSTDWIEIVGVVGDVPNRGLGEAAAPAVYLPYTLWVGDNPGLIVRARNPLGLVRAIREEVDRAAPGQAIRNVRTGEYLLRRNGWWNEEVVATLFGLFAGLALVLAAIGLYSALAYASALRMQEFGIRVALGATKGDVIRLVLRPAVATVAVGIAVGLAASVAANKVLQSWTEVSVYDPWVLGGIVVVLAAVAAVAGLIPAVRAAAADPARALRV